jgi:hypothetical protein
MNNAG